MFEKRLFVYSFVLTGVSHFDLALDWPFCNKHVKGCELYKYDIILDISASVLLRMPFPFNVPFSSLGVCTVTFLTAQSCYLNKDFRPRWMKTFREQEIVSDVLDV